MSGDAVTLVEAWAQGGRDESSLAAVRNLRRRPDYTRERLAEHCYAADFQGDIRRPDWPVLMGPLLMMGEVVKKLDVASVRWEELLDVRVGVIVTNEHAVAVFNIGEGVFRMYDNDSPERSRGTYSERRADELADDYALGYIVAVMNDGSDLSARLGPAITTLVQRAQRERAARPREAEREPRRVRQRAGRTRPRTEEGAPPRAARQRTLDMWMREA